MQEKDIRNLLYSIPEDADYAVEPAELDREDIPTERVQGLEELLKQGIETFQVARLLTAWGYDSGFEVLTDLFDKGELEGYISHRLHGYDETYKYVLDSFILYWLNQGELGNYTEAEEKVFPYIEKIISDSFKKPYDLDPLVTFLQFSSHRQKLIDLIKQNLNNLTKGEANFYWRVRSDLSLIAPYEPRFVDHFIEKYSLNRNEYLDEYDKIL